MKYPAGDFRLPLIDRREALDALGGDVGIFDVLAEIFREDAPALLADLRQVVQVGTNSGTVREVVHRLKGLTATFYASQLVELLQSIEAAAAAGDCEPAQAALIMVEKGIAQMLTELEAQIG